MEEGETESQADISATSPFLGPATPKPPKLTSYPAISSLSYFEDPQNWRDKPWRDPCPLTLDLSSPPPNSGSWIQNTPLPPAGWDLGVRDCVRCNEQALSKNNLSPTRQEILQAEEDSCREILAWSELEYGQGHEEILNALRNLAFALYKRCRYGSAEALLRRAVEGGRKAFGGEDLAVLETNLHLSIVVQEQGKYSEAEHLQRQLLDSITKVAGEEHKHTLQTKLSLAVSLTCQNRFDESAHLQWEVLEICRKRFGSMDAFTLQAIGDLTLSLVRQGTRSQSVESGRHEWDVRKNVLGKVHPHTVRAKLLFATALSEVGKQDASNMLIEEVWGYRKQHLATNILILSKWKPTVPLATVSKDSTA
jgi:tetratricopeptide (TPR) repeat protein